MGILLLTSFVMAYYRSQTNYVQYGPYDRTNFLGTEGMFSDRMCQAGQDFILQVNPLGCEPAMVRSDLLEEQNVPVFCPISATQMNPLIDVQAINTITITGRYPKEVATVGFHPAEAALNPYQNELSQPVILDNIGYAVIVLRKQENESAMPDYVEGNLTARIRYDIQNAFGVGQAQFYLPVLDENDWGEKYKQYSFWDGRGYLRAEGVYDDQATISIYSDQYRSGVLGQGDSKMVYSTITLREGETSNELYIPGFDFCLATMKIKLDDLEAPDTRARFSVNGNPVEVKSGERFLENNCKVISEPVKNGINSEVKLTCNEDREGFHTGAINLKIVPNIILNIEGEDRNFSVGDYLYEYDPLIGKEKKVFLAYAGTVGNTGEEENLFAYLMAIPKEKHLEDKLTLDEIQNAKQIVKSLNYETEVEKKNLWQLFKEDLQAKLGVASEFWNWLKDGEFFNGVAYTNPKPIPMFGKDVKLIGFAGAYDTQIPKEVEDEFNLAVEDYKTIIDSFPDEENLGKDTTLGESALYELISLANEVGQKRTMIEYCKEFRQRYPNSKQSLEMCDNEMKMSNSASSITEVLIDDHVYQISFEGIYEPTALEYSAKVRVNYPGGNVSTYTLTKNDVIYLDNAENEYFMLVDLEEDSAKLDLNIKREGIIGDAFEGHLEWISLNAPESFNTGYTLTLIEVNLKKVAKVSLIPNIDYAQTNASFNFRVNIDKRDIKLSPEKTQEKIDKLEKDIELWGEISENLGKFVKTMKLACLGTSAYLNVKNYLENIGGKGIARDTMMNSKDGWYNLCDDWVDEGFPRPGGKGQPYKTQEECLIKESDNIDKDVDEYYTFMSKRQEYIQGIQDDYVLAGETLFSGKTINSSGFAWDFSEKVNTNLDNLEKSFPDPEGHGDPINIEDMKAVISKEGYEQNKYEIEQLRDIDVYTKILENSDNERLKEMARKDLYSTFLDIQVNSKEYRALQDISSRYGSRESIFVSTKWIDQYPLSNPNTFEEIENKFTGGDSIDSLAPVVTSIDQSTAEEYLFVLNDDYVVTQTYVIDKENNNRLSVKNEKNTNPLGVGFEKYNDASYKNEYKNAEVRYYETEPYKGYPAVVPFDLKEGWYVSVSQGLPVFGKTASYSESGRVESYYLCNVGGNGREENRKGDDICRSVVSLQGDSSNQFPGISDKGKVSSLLIAASNAVEQAQDEHETGVRYVTINHNRIEVGNPAVDVPGLKCQDFMSPKDCNILFNVCDPVICPSSRCDFGGKYPVQDVVQSGIIGSIALCLPNAREGIYVPVCLTGVQAGLDGLLSIFGSYKDCLQESLDTGQTVGVCDEVQSVYLCEYFYRQAIPIAKLGIPKLTELIVSGGKGSRGGGEYLGVADAWQRAEASVGYFAQYYAQNSYKAFKARSMEEAGQEIVCDKFLSISYPGGGSLLDAITTPDSPVQFYGRFDEIPFTTVTNPPQSQYKVYYHIYAGKDRGTYYRVYFKGDIGSSYYQDTMFRVDVATGYIPRGEYASETKDFTAPSGYKELCIMVNGQEECGFKEVTTNFAANYVGDSYLKNQASQTDIKTESDCISGTSSLYSLLNPNIQAGAEDLTNPAIYNEGIIRICATRNPGEGTDDAMAGQEGSRWREVGYCGDSNLKCWLDTKSVEKAIDFENLEEDVLNVTNANYQSILEAEGGYLSKASFSSEIEKIGDEKLNIEKIKLINEIIEKVFYNNQKASLLYLRGNAYAGIVRGLYEGYKGGQETGECEGVGERVCVNNEIYKKCSKDLEWEEFPCPSTKKCMDTSYGAKCVDEGETEDCEVVGERVCIDDDTYKKCSKDLEWEEFPCPSTKKCMNTPYGAKCVEMEGETGEEEIFVIKPTFLQKITLGTNLYYKYENEWKWTPYSDKSIWMSATTTIVTSGRYEGKNVASKNADIIESLKGKSYIDGKEILKDNGGLMEDGSEIVLSASSSGETTEEQEQLNEILNNKWGWESWKDIRDNTDFSKYFDTEERLVISNAKSCDDCGKELPNRKGGTNVCNEAECIAIGFRLRNLSLGKMCVHKGLWRCEEVILEGEISSNLEPIEDLNIPGGITCPKPPEVTPDIQAIEIPSSKVVEQVKKLRGQVVPKDLDVDSNNITNCFDPAKYVYDSAGVELSCIYSDRIGTEYNVFGTTIETESAPTQKEMDAGVPYPAFAVNEGCDILGKSGQDKLDILYRGDLISYAYDSRQGHSVIFVGWDPEPPIARVFGWKMSGTGHIFDYSTVNLSDNKNPTYMIWKPELASFGGGDFGGAGAGGEY